MSDELLQSHAELLGTLIGLKMGLTMGPRTTALVDDAIAKAGRVHDAELEARGLAKVDRAGGTAAVSADEAATPDVGGSDDTWSAGQGEADA